MQIGRRKRFLNMELPASLIEGNIRRGAILHSGMFEEVGHGKFFVVMGVTDDYIAGFFFINSNIHRSLFDKPDQLAMQYPLRHADYEFLRYDSFLCASSLIKRHKNYIAHSIEYGETTFVGTLREEHLNEVLEMARHSRLFSKADKDRFFY